MFEIRRKINLLLLSTLAEVKKRGSLISELEVNTPEIKRLEAFLKEKKFGNFQIKSIARSTSYLSEKIFISLELES